MKKKVENIENKPIEKLFKNRFKEQLVQQFEDKEITEVRGWQSHPCQLDRSVW
jgi:hypothetical protein